MAEEYKYRKLIVDPGSTHGGQYDLAVLHIKKARDAGAHAVKFQLFPATNDVRRAHNIPLPYKFMPKLVEVGRQCGVEVFASVWNKSAVDMLIDCNCDSVKLAYSQRHNDMLCKYIQGSFNVVYISGDPMTGWPSIAHTRLYCIPQYPVQYEVAYDELFPLRFQGWSSHVMGIRQDLKALEAGAIIIEKHTLLGNHPVDCADSRFAVDYSHIETLAKEML